MYSAAPNYSYIRQTSAFNSNTTYARNDALSDTPVANDESAKSAGIDVSQLKQLHAKPVSAADNPEIRDMMATNWLRVHGASASQPSVSDDAPQNTYAYVKVDGKTVATLYNGGSSAMTGEAAAKVSSLQDPPGLSGPDLAQWRADNYAKLLGGTVEKAPTAITRSQWAPHPSASTTYTRDQLDAAFQAMLAEGQKSVAQSQASYLASSAHTGASADHSV
jgi:hypothetical protein